MTQTSDIITNIQKYSRQADEKTLIQKHQWVTFDQDSSIKTNYIFRDNNELLISENGKIKNAQWEYLANHTIAIRTSESSILFKISFLDDSLLVLNIDNTKNYSFFITETKFGNDFNSLDKLNNYLEKVYVLKLKNEPSFDNYKSISSQEGVPEQKIDLILGSHDKVKIFYSDSKTGYIYKGKLTGKYYYLHKLYGKTYCKDKDDCIFQLYLNLNGQK
jgi:hypothetical protein